ncbi:MAG: MATE family efflux transporter, partial [Acidobacteria bacterium]|nr:MATE family efflux transporter [Acidobacteriota bacterium]
MYDLPAIRREVRALVRLAVPVALTQLAAMTMWVVDLVMVGRLGVESLAAVSLGRTWVMATLILGS